MKCYRDPLRQTKLNFTALRKDNGNYVILQLKTVTFDHSLPRTVVLSQGLFVSQRTFWQCQKTFLVVTLGVGCNWHLVGRDQEFW